MKGDEACDHAIGRYIDKTLWGNISALTPNSWSKYPDSSSIARAFEASNTTFAMQLSTDMALKATNRTSKGNAKPVSQATQSDAYPKTDTQKSRKSMRGDKTTQEELDGNNTRLRSHLVQPN